MRNHFVQTLPTHRKAPQQSAPSGRMHGAPALPQQTWPRLVLPQTSPAQHDVPVHEYVAGRQQPPLMHSS